MSFDLTREELTATLDAVAGAVLASAGAGEPPVDAIAIAQQLGITVAWDDKQAGRARVAHLSGAGQGAAIFLQRDPRIERQQWAVAHEIGETMAHRVFGQLGIDPAEAPRQAREEIANGLASRILLPPDSFAADAPALAWDLFALKQRYSTASHELIARRMLDMSPPVIISLFDQNRQTWRKSNLPTRPPKPSPRELELREHAHRTGQSTGDDGPPRIQVWAIHEPMWQREIVRVEIDEFL